MDEAILLEDVHKSFGRVHAVRGLSLCVEPGAVVGFLGLNGAGKTTAIRLLAGLLRPDKGTAAVLGHESWTLPADVRRRIGYEGSGILPGAMCLMFVFDALVTGSLAVFFTRDLASFYLAFALASLAAYGLVVHDGTARARRAGVIYLLLAVLGEILLLAAFALLATASPSDTLAIATTVADLVASPWREPMAAKARKLTPVPTKLRMRNAAASARSGSATAKAKGTAA